MWIPIAKLMRRLSNFTNFEIYLYLCKLFFTNVLNMGLLFLLTLTTHSCDAVSLPTLFLHRLNSLWRGLNTVLACGVYFSSLNPVWWRRKGNCAANTWNCARNTWRFWSHSPQMPQTDFTIPRPSFLSSSRSFNCQRYKQNQDILKVINYVQSFLLYIPVLYFQFEKEGKYLSTL